MAPHTERGATTCVKFNECFSTLFYASILTTLHSLVVVVVEFLPVLKLCVGIGTLGTILGLIQEIKYFTGILQ